jgi:hypothetical protein
LSPRAADLSLPLTLEALYLSTRSKAVPPGEKVAEGPKKGKLRRERGLMGRFNLKFSRQAW